MFAVVPCVGPSALWTWVILTRAFGPGWYILRAFRAYCVFSGSRIQRSVRRKMLWPVSLSIQTLADSLLAVRVGARRRWRRVASPAHAREDLRAGRVRRENWWRVRFGAELDAWQFPFKRYAMRGLLCQSRVSLNGGGRRSRRQAMAAHNLHDHRAIRRAARCCDEDRLHLAKVFGT
jgi:hypothetical protein